jgi:regulator of sigma E protease
MELIHTLFYFIVAIGLLVSFHEFGHFWVARKTGVKVLRFSVGFGKVVWKYQKSPETTEYVLSAIPLGGYVKMVDEREGEVAEQDLPYAFNRQPIWVRTAIVAAGPIFNLVLAIFLYWCVFTLGETGLRPIIGEIEQGTLAADAGFVTGEEIKFVNGDKAFTWSETMGMIFTAAIDSEAGIKVLVESNTGEQQLRTINVPNAISQDPENLFQHLGFKPWSPTLAPVIGKVLENRPAAVAGLQTGDLIISADDNVMSEWMHWVDYVRSHPGVPIILKIERDGVLLQVSITPDVIVIEQGEKGQIGATVFVPEGLRESVMVEYSLPPLQALQAAFKKTYYYSSATLKMLGNMLLGNASVKNLSGPISIAQYAGQSAEMGFIHFLKFLALISISLGVINLLPVPVLDGGHLMFFAVEALKGSPVSMQAQIFFQNIGIALLMLLMGLAVFLDIERLIQ